MKQLVLPCYKVELAMGVEAWYFLHGTTAGVCNLTYFISLLSRMAVVETQQAKRGLGYALHPGQADGSMLSLAKEWNIGRKAVSRLLEDFERRKLIRTCSNPITTLIDMMCVKSWMQDGQPIENPTYRQTVKAYEGVRIYLFNGQRLETLRKSSANRKKPKDENKVESGKKPAQVPQPNPTQLTEKGMTEEADSPATLPFANTDGATILTEVKPPTTQEKGSMFDGNPSYI